MVENLLHAHIALSRTQLTELAELGITGGNAALGTMTYLGADYPFGTTVFFLLRFEKDVYGTPVTPMAIRKAFGPEFTVFAGDAKGTKSSDVRVLVTMHLKDSIRSPYGFLKAQCKRFARELVKTHIELDWDEMPQQYHHQVITDDELPIPTSNDLYEAGLSAERTDR